MSKTIGGGATSIATKTGLLRTLAKSDLLIVSGGGGGSYTGNGADAGGMSGSGGNSGNQLTGYMFGQGAYGNGGGGGGLYGGSSPSGAGSGYIGNTKMGSKKMVGYNVPESSSADTKTISVQEYSQKHTKDKAKAGNGFARITFVDNVYPPSTFRRVTTLLDDTQGIKDVALGSTRNMGGSCAYDSSNNYYTFTVAYSNSFAWTTPFTKDKATKLYIELSSYGSDSYKDVVPCVWKNLSFGSGYDSFSANVRKYTYAISWYSHVNYAGTSPWYDLARTVIPIDLSAIGNEETFYIGCYSNGASGTIYKIYFDNEAAIIP